MIDLILMLALFILFALFNGYVIIWQQAKVMYARTGELSFRKQANRYSNIWHGISVAMKVVGLVWFLRATWPVQWTWGYVGQLMIICVIMYTGYNLIINSVMRSFNPEVSFWHIDGRPFNQWIVRNFGRFGYWAVQSLMILISVVGIVYNNKKIKK